MYLCSLQGEGKKSFSPETIGSGQAHLAQTQSYCPTLGPEEREGLRQSLPSLWPQAGSGPPSGGLAAATSSAVAFLRGTCPGPQALRCRPALGRVPSTAHEAGGPGLVKGAAATVLQCPMYKEAALHHAHTPTRPKTPSPLCCAGCTACCSAKMPDLAHLQTVGAGERPNHQPVPLPSLPFGKTKSNESTIPQ